MKHALIIGRNQDAADQIAKDLWDAGYCLVIRAVDSNEAWSAVRSVRPAVILVLVEATAPSAETLCEMNEETGAPIIAVAANPHEALNQFGPGVSLVGPYATGQVEKARSAGMNRRSRLAHVA